MGWVWWRWSWRDLRARWVQVTTIAFIIALGSGTYSGLTSTSDWRQVSYDASYARLHMYDLRVTLASGSYVDAAALARVADRLRSTGVLRDASAELTGPIQVDASRKGHTILVPGRIVGVDPAAGGPMVSRIEATSGRAFRSADAGRDVAVIDTHFATRRGVRPGDTIRVSGDRTLRVVGRGISPEHFIVLGEAGGFFAEANYAVTFVPITTAQSLLARPGAANVLVARVRSGVSVAAARSQLREALAEEFPTTGVTITHRSRDRGYRLLYDDIEGDQRLYNIFAVLILLGAAFAAFNLTARIVEAQRREIGIGMALGVPGRRLAIRPVLIAAQIALLGAGLGILVGLGLGELMIGVLRSYFPLPVWRQDFEFATFARGAALGVVLPFAATLLPVWRAVHVTPVEAIRTGVVGRRNRRAGAWLRRIPIPGRSSGALPLRNVVREPRRTIMTALGIAASIAVLLGVVGMLDSFYATIDRAGDELGTSSPRRVTVTLSSFVPESDPVVEIARSSSLVAQSAVELQLPGTVRSADTKFEVLMIIGDFESRVWHPTIDDRVGGSGVLLAEKAAHDLGVRPGDRVMLRYPRRDGAVSYTFVERSVRVIGTSPFPMRSMVWIDRSVGQAMTNLGGITNVVVVEPRRGVTAAQLQRALFQVPGVSSVQPVSAYAQSLRKELDRALGILTIVEGAVLLLALLIAFNTASINADDRARENATMFAFGFPLRSVVAMEVTESLLIGILGTAIGIGSGWLLLDWLITELLPTTIPDLGIVTALSGRTLLIAIALGVLAVALAPLLTLRKLRRMDIPSTLRVVE